MVNGEATANLGSNVTVTDANDATVTITIGPNAPVGRHNVTVAHMNLPTLAAILGHANVQMTMRYVRPAAE